VSLTARFIDLAEADVVDAWEWHEDQQTGLGNRFLDAVTAAVQRAQRWPNTGAPVAWDSDGEIIERRMATRGFKWAIRYRVIDGDLVVMAVHHQRRHPDHATDRQP
jgi:toxin ParE2